MPSKTYYGPRVRATSKAGGIRGEDFELAPCQTAPYPFARRLESLAVAKSALGEARHEVVPRTLPAVLAAALLAVLSGCVDGTGEGYATLEGVSVGPDGAVVIGTGFPRGHGNPLALIDGGFECCNFDECVERCENSGAYECHCKENSLASGWCCCYEGWPCTLCGEGGGGGGGGGGLEHGEGRMTAMGRAASAALATALATGGATAQSVDDQRAIVRELLSGDWEVVADALGRLPPIPGGCEYCGGSGEVAFEDGYQTPELASALIAALEHEIRRARQAGWGRRMFEREGHPETLSWLGHAVAATGHPGAFDILLDAQLWGVAVPLFRTYGARAVDAWLSRTLEDARNPEADEDAAASALIDLRTEAYGNRERGEALEPWLHDAMREVAILHIERDAVPDVGEVSELLFGVAVGLAAALRDPEVDAALRTACEGWRPPAGSAHEPYAKRGCARSHEKAEYMQRITGLTYSRSGN